MKHEISLVLRIGLVWPLLACQRPYPAVQPRVRPDPAASREEKLPPDRDAPLPAPPAAYADPNKPAPARLLEEAFRELSAMRITHASKETRIEEEQGRFEYSGSVFVDYALSIAAPAALEPMDSLMKGNHATAKTYVALLNSMAPGTSRGPWTRLKHVRELGPGDVIAWLKPPLLKDQATGHAMIVEAAPRARDPSEWVVPIIDSSRGHGGADRRHDPEATGLGRGTIVLVAPAGVPRAFRWTEVLDVPDSLLLETTIVMGRLR